ncbi:MAG: ORF6N domain-containing protein [Erysipelotrichaceae bacterium]|nr:ORF6N domain-containing protein [Erysipelotrichaceae bacterium]
MINKQLPQPNLIDSRIYTLRGQQVMLDKDLARIYGYEVKYLNRQVKRNMNRFPDDFMFRLTKEEYTQLRCQNVTANLSSKTRSLPYVFTEQGVYMLATVLKGELAEKQSIQIMRAFREMRSLIFPTNTSISRQELQWITSSYDAEIHQLKQKIKKINKTLILDPELKDLVIYKGKRFEADKAYIDIYKKAKKSIYLVDNYVDIKTLHLLSHKQSQVKVILFSENRKGSNGRLTKSEVDDFNTEYPHLKLKPNPDCHDRFIVIDYGTKDEQVYLSGTSCKDAGNKVCTISRINDVAIMKPVIARLLSRKDKKL